MKQLTLIISLLFLSAACSFNGGFQAKNKATEGSAGISTIPNYTPTNLTKSITAASKTLLQRLPTADEYSRASKGVTDYEAVLREYLSNPVFLTTMRTYHNDYFEMSGQGTGNTANVNFNEPTNIILYIIANNRDYREAITASYCVDNNLNETPFCNSFANAADAQNQAAGVITTRGFLAKWAGPHNFRRVKHAFINFACSEYPDGNDVDNPMTVDEISNSQRPQASTADFNATNVSPVCFNCHRSINPRAVLFLNFRGLDNNQIGTYVASPTGNNQYPNNTVPTEVAGRNSRIQDLLQRPDGTVPVPRYHGVEVSKVKDYATMLSQGEQYRHCTAQRFFNFMMGRPAMEPLPEGLNYLETKLNDTNYNIKELIIEVSKSFAYVNR